MLRALLPLLLAPLLAIGLACPVAAAETREVAGFGPNPGNIRMYAHVPDGLPAGSPLVVAIHGCTQSALGFDDESGWTDVAERLRFALVLPEQQPANNRDRCFNFFAAEDNRRDQGEAASIKAMVDRMVTDHGLDPGRVFVTGLSAGGAMTSVMLAAYPDVFKGGAIIAGVPYGCASTERDPVLMFYRQLYVLNPWLGEGGWAASRCGISRGVPPFPPVRREPADWRRLVGEAQGGSPAAWPRVSLWHGGADRTVYPDNLEELVDQWTAVHGADQTPERDETAPAYARREFADAAGTVVVESYALPGFGHAVPIDPGAGPNQCGRATGGHFVDRDVCAAMLIARFWGLGGAS